MKAEALKERLKKKYEEEAILAKQNLERASADVCFKYVQQLFRFLIKIICAFI